jgi:hypothetical protein
MSQLRPLLACMLLAACPIFACSVINKYDDVVPAKTGSGGNGNTSSGGNSTGGLATGGLDEMAGEAGASTGGTNSGGTSTGGAGSLPAHGLLAVAGTDPTKADGSVVSLIDPATGLELARQTITGGAAVAGLAYDGAIGKDVWYELTAASYPADPTSVAALQVYQFTDTGAVWKAISSKALVGLPPPRPHSFVVLNDRLAYLSYTIVAGQPVDSLTVLDTTDPTAVKQLKLTLTLPAGMGVEVLGMVGTRGVLGDETAPGGTLAIMIGNGCTGQNILRVCGPVQLLPVTVSDDASAGVAVDLSPTLIGEPGFTSAQSTQLGYVAFTPALTKTVSLKYFDPRKLSAISSGAPPYQAHWLGGLAYAECQDVGLFTAVANKTLFSSSSAGLSDDVPLSHDGQDLVYEPFTGHIITLFNPDNAEFADAASLPGSGDGGAGGSDAGTPALSSFDVTSSAVLSRTPAAKWAPPTNLAPNIAVARFPISFVCK